MYSTLNLNKKKIYLLRIIISRIFYALTFYCGIFFLIRFLNNKKNRHTTVLTFHRVRNSENSEILHSLPTSFVSTCNFERLIKFLIKYYKVILLSDYLEKHKNLNKFARNTVIITFDDGYKDIYTDALPVLKKYNIPATVFLTSSFINSNKVFWWDRVYDYCKNTDVNFQSQNPYEKYSIALKKRLLAIFSTDKKNRDQLLINLITELQNYDYSTLQLFMDDINNSIDYDSSKADYDNQMLTWKDIYELQDNGISFGSHTKSHIFFNNNIPNDIILNEVLNSKRELEEKLKNKVIAFAYPGGKITSKVKNVVKESGYHVAFTQNPGCNSLSDDMFELKRINVWNGTVTTLDGRFSKSKFAFQLIRKSFIQL